MSEKLSLATGGKLDRPFASLAAKRELANYCASSRVKACNFITGETVESDEASVSE